ncbi:hypothetical protein PoB_004683700 [Plakobranchus ocellatus]|uniref:Uncharacterized protein n=1 Tax=Plakobranchus ocellatus TaxID=259542 RepID=A0AAV4BLV7_9GAST|nr:hypothetical protein PoB_004683700 [Plakobranchus ocellatus]
MGSSPATDTLARRRAWKPEITFIYTSYNAQNQTLIMTVVFLKLLNYFLTHPQSAFITILRASPTLLSLLSGPFTSPDPSIKFDISCQENPSALSLGNHWDTGLPAMGRRRRKGGAVKGGISVSNTIVSTFGYKDVIFEGHRVVVVLRMLVLMTSAWKTLRVYRVEHYCIGENPEIIWKWVWFGVSMWVSGWTKRVNIDFSTKFENVDKARIVGNIVTLYGDSIIRLSRNEPINCDDQSTGEATWSRNGQTIAASKSSQPCDQFQAGEHIPGSESTEVGYTSRHHWTRPALVPAGTSCLSTSKRRLAQAACRMIIPVLDQRVDKWTWLS